LIGAVGAEMVVDDIEVHRQTRRVSGIDEPAEVIG
jgi:hypothetical protein